VKLASAPSDIDDVIDETYLALCNALNSCTAINNPKAWLYSTANNIINKKYAEINKQKSKCVSINCVESELFYENDFDNVLLSDDAIEKIKNDIFDELQETEKILYNLIYTKKLKGKEIAKILNISPSAVKQRNYRLKRKIKLIAKEKLKYF
jgi:RNA polymerase sigma factor (sigma-70 family)